MQTRELGTDYLAVPDGPGPFPAVVVIHEAFGLNENIRDVCRRFAGQGYVALGADVFRGRSSAICMARILGGLVQGKIEDNYGLPPLRDALERLGALPEVDADRIGAVGYCLGGSLALTWAAADDRLKAIAPYYGMAPKPAEAMRRSCPVVGSWPDKDFTTKAAASVEAELQAAGVPHDIKVYEGAKHSFFNDQSPRTYDPAAAADSWERVLAFFETHVRGAKG